MNSNNKAPMTSLEKRASATLALLFFLRMYSLFMVLPVLTIAATEFTNNTALLTGIALGIYGLTQALMQIPFGVWSDRFGRKPVILLGLILFLIGSIIAAFADSIYWLILGRALQGAGAIAAAIMALAADLSREQHRTKVMAFIGMSIGLAFSLAFVTGPLIFETLALKGVFLLSGVLAILAMIILYVLVPTPETTVDRDRFVSDKLSEVFGNSNLMRLNFSIFCSHFILMANFVVLPIVLAQNVQLETVKHWQFYLPLLIVAILIMVPMIIVGDKRKQKQKQVFLAAVGMFILGQIFMAFTFEHIFALFLSTVIFFAAFNFFEAFLPARVSSLTEPENRGTALGVYSTIQFLGIFLGGAVGGYCFGAWGIQSVFLLSAGLSVIWLILVSGINLTSKEESISESHD